jgi:hypothetical protein
MKPFLAPFLRNEFVTAGRWVQPAVRPLIQPSTGLPLPSSLQLQAEATASAVDESVKSARTAVSQWFRGGGRQRR